MLPSQYAIIETGSIIAMYLCVCVILILMCMLLFHLVTESPQKKFDRLLDDRCASKRDKAASKVPKIPQNQ